MKTFLTMLMMLCAANNALTAQTFTVLATDSTGDGSYLPDIKTFSYRMDVMQDSIWFKIETATAFEIMDGFMIGLDTNQNPMDGEAWNVQGTLTTRKFDHALFVTYDFATGSHLEVNLGNKHSHSPISSNVYLADTNILQFSAKLTLLDADRKFNLMLGAGSFDIHSTGYTYDQSPETGYLTIAAPTTAIHKVSAAQLLSFYPNPAASSLNWDAGQNFQPAATVAVYDALGKKVTHTTYATGTMDISSIEPGVYFIRFGEIISRFVKQ